MIDKHTKGLLHGAPAELHPGHHLRRAVDRQGGPREGCLHDRARRDQLGQLGGDADQRPGARA